MRSFAELKDNTVLNLDGRKAEDNLAIAKLASSLENNGANLKHIILKRSDLITEKTISTIAKHCFQLETLTLDSCYALKIGDLKVLPFLKNLQKGYPNIFNNIMQAKWNNISKVFLSCNDVFIEDRAVNERRSTLTATVKLHKKNSPTTIIRLSSNQTGKKSAEELVEKLNKNKMTTAIYLRSSHLNKEDVKALTEALKKNNTVTTLDLGQNNLCNAGAINVGDMLKQNCSLASIDLAYNNIGDEGAEKISYGLRHNDTVGSLDLSHNDISDEGAKCIANALKENRSLRKIDLSENKISDEGAKYIADTLKQNNKVTEINLSFNKIGDKGGGYIADALKQNEKIEVIYLSDNQIGDEGAYKLADVLKQHKTISRVDLAVNHMGNEGVKRIADALKQNKTITEAHVNFNSKASQESAKYIAEIHTYLQRNQFLVKQNLIAQTMSDLYIRRIGTGEEPVNYGPPVKGEWIEKKDTLQIARYSINKNTNIRELENALEALQQVMDDKRTAYKAVFSEKLVNAIIIPAFNEANREVDTKVIGTITKLIHNKPRLKTHLGKNINQTRLQFKEQLGAVLSNATVTNEDLKQLVTDFDNKLLEKRPKRLAQSSQERSIRQKLSQKGQFR